MDILKFALICCCFLNTFRMSGYNNDSKMLQLAMFFTVMADFQMIILKNNELGILFFCIVQLIYSFRYGGELYGKSVLKYVGILSILLILLNLGTLYFLAILYCAIFCASLMSVFLQKRYIWPNNILIKGGMISFALCDINVALANNSPWFLIEHRGAFSSLIWIFYLPAQIMLSYSAYRYARE